MCHWAFDSHSGACEQQVWSVITVPDFNTFAPKQDKNKNTRIYYTANDADNLEGVLFGAVGQKYSKIESEENARRPPFSLG